MNNKDTEIFLDYLNRRIRLTQERKEHILEHPEMKGQLAWISDTLLNPEVVVATKADKTVHVYHRYYPITTVASKYLLVAVKIGIDDAFVLTAFFSNRQKKGVIVWMA